MVRKMVIALAAVASVTAGSTFSAEAGHGGGMRHGGFGGHGVGHATIGHPSRIGGVVAARPFASGANRFAFRNRFDSRHRFFRNRFVFVGAPFLYGYDYGYDDYCYTRVWTRWGWRRMSVCY